MTYVFNSMKQVYLQKLVKTFYSLYSKFAACTASYQRIICSDVADNLLIIRSEFIQRIKGAVNRHFVNFFCFTLIRCADNSLYELGLSRLFILVSYYGRNCNYF